MCAPCRTVQEIALQPASAATATASSMFVHCKCRETRQRRVCLLADPGPVCADSPRPATSGAAASSFRTSRRVGADCDMCVLLSLRAEMLRQILDDGLQLLW